MADTPMHRHFLAYKGIPSYVLPKPGSARRQGLAVDWLVYQAKVAAWAGANGLPGAIPARGGYYIPSPEAFDAAAAKWNEAHHYATA